MHILRFAVTVDPANSALAEGKAAIDAARARVRGGSGLPQEGRGHSALAADCGSRAGSNASPSPLVSVFTTGSAVYSAPAPFFASACT